MIKANELRIGNYVYFENPHSDYAKIKISSNDFKNFERNNCFPNFEPIEITEKWLLKAGFKNEGVHYCKDFVHNNLKIKIGVEIYGYLNLKYFNHIKYVHQLQNLYFALTGSELVFSTEP